MSDQYIVKSGDTLWRIAMMHNVTVQELKEFNDLVSDRIWLGQRLDISQGPVTAPVKPKPKDESVPGKCQGEKSWPAVVLGRPKLPSVEGDYTGPMGVYTRAELEDICLLARLVHAEARGEPYVGQVAVAAVLLNRVENGDFPNTIHEVVYQPRQFEPVDNGAINYTPNNKAYEAVFDALAGKDPTDGALFFWNPDMVSKTSWVWTRRITSRIGNHVFGV